MPTSVDVAQITYPQSDGQPMADNTKQFRWIVTIQGGLDALFRENPQVFVAGDLLWYPIEGHPEICMAPDALVAFGRPKGDRGSYLQWEEGGIAPQVVFEILSPGNTIAGMTRKFRFYERYGVAEYYLYNPDTGELSGWQRQGGTLEEIEPMAGWVSPRLGIRFEIERGVLQLYRPDGERFATYVELMQQCEQEHQRAEQERQRAERLAARLRALGIELEEEG
jgi:Uma2 family endonuclease